MSVIVIDEFGDDSDYDFVPYRLRMPISDDLHALREELSLQTELHGARSVEAQVAFENLFRTSCRIGRPLDGLRRFSKDEDERFFAQTRNGTDGHVYWLGAQHGFSRNDGKTRRPARWWYEKLHGPLASDPGRRRQLRPEGLHQPGASVRRPRHGAPALHGRADAERDQGGGSPDSATSRTPSSGSSRGAHRPRPSTRFASAPGRRR